MWSEIRDLASYQTKKMEKTSVQLECDDADVDARAWLITLRFELRLLEGLVFQP